MNEVAPVEPDPRCEPRLTVVDGAEPTPSDVVVCLACASADVEALTRILPGLASEGSRLRMLPGVELEEAIMAEAVTETPGAAVFVICVSDALEGRQVRRLVESFTAHRSRAHRLLVLELEHQRPHALVSMVRRTAESLRRQLDMILVSPDDRATAAVHGMRILRLEEPVIPARPDRRVIVGSPLRDEVGPIPEHIRTPQPAVPRSRLRLVGGEEAEVDRTSADTPTMRMSMAEVEIDAEEAAANEPPRREPARWGISLLAIALFAAVVVGALRLPSLELAAAELELEDVRAGSVGVSLLGDSLVIPRLRDTEREAAGGEWASADLASGDEVLEEPELAPRVSSITTRALALGIISNHEGLHVTRPPSDPADWRAASRFCRRWSEAGISEWRLPLSAELEELWRAGLVPEGAFWTTSLVMRSEVPANWVLRSETGQVEAREKTMTADVLCVYAPRRSPD